MDEYTDGLGVTIRLRLSTVPFLGSEGIPALHTALHMASGRRAY